MQNLLSDHNGIKLKTKRYLEAPSNIYMLNVTFVETLCVKENKIYKQSELTKTKNSAFLSVWHTGKVLLRLKFIAGKLKLEKIEDVKSMS